MCSLVNFEESVFIFLEPILISYMPKLILCNMNSEPRSSFEINTEAMSLEEDFVNKIPPDRWFSCFLEIVFESRTVQLIE